MRKGTTLSATARAERSRQTTKAAIARELLYAGILARIWPSFVMTPAPRCVSEAEQPIWRILCVESPAGKLSWKLSPEEYTAFDWVPIRKHNGEKVTDRTAVLLALATDGSWKC